MNDLLEMLEEDQKKSVLILYQFINCYNSLDGSGLFSGIDRYSYLESRAKIAALQNTTLMAFWGTLREKLNCPIQPKKFDNEISEIWRTKDPHKVLKILATQTSECITLARMLHDDEKKKKKADKEAVSEQPLNDSIEDIS